jgi:ribosomal protein S18 acetylase RimI-like enzyme
MSMMTVRAAIIEDADAIERLTVEVQQLHREALPDIFKSPSDKLFPREKLATLLQDANSTVAVAESKGEIIGHIYAVIVHRPENDFKKAEKYMYIQQIGVRKDARRQGVGRALIGFIESKALASAVTGLQLDYWAFNTRAQSFFESCGFSASQVMMRRRLPPQ